MRSWNSGWYDAPTRVGEKIARIVGAGPGQVIVADSTSVNLFKLVMAGLRLREGRTGIVEFSPSRALIFDCSFVAARQSEYTILGDQGRISASRTFHPGRGCDVEIVVEIGGKSRVEQIAAMNEYRLEVEHFSSCIRSGTHPAISRNASLQNLRIIEALQQSARTGSRIQIVS